MTTLNSVPGQKTPRKILLNSLNLGKTASTYLFYGDDGVGKWQMAMALAALLNCENLLKGPDGKITDACSQCRNCRQIANYSFSELLFGLPLPPYKNDKEYTDSYISFIEAKKFEPYRVITSNRQITIPIDSAREIKRKCAIRPPAGFKRIVLIYQMEKMLPGSADSLLKLIEEPPPETVIILTANSPSNLLPTIQSRSQKIRFGPIPGSEIADYISRKYDLSAEKALFAARLGRGSIGKALSFISGADEANPIQKPHVITSEVKDMEMSDDAEVAMSLRQKSFLMFKGLFLKDTPSALETIDNFLSINDRGEAEKILEQWQSFLSDMIRAKYGGDTSGIINSDFAHDIDGFAIKVPDAELFSRLTEEIKYVLLGLRRNTHIRPAITALAIRLRRSLNQSP